MKTNFDNPAEVIIAVESSDSEKFSRMISSPVNMETKKESKSNKNLMSKASQQFLKTIE
ncbi:MAG: hypothetical protein SGJ02_10875 [bacterium]|nr:hypothetical protein [bacterium]